MITVKYLIGAAGLNPWLSYPSFEEAVRFADAIAARIENPIVRVGFVAQAAKDLSREEPESWGKFPWESLPDNASHFGPTELWG